MSERTRILVVQGRDRLANPLQAALDQAEVVRATSVSEALALMSRDHFDVVCADSADPTLHTDLRDLGQGRKLLEALAAGVALVDGGLEVVWSNASFEACCGGPVRGRGFYEALGSPEILGPDYSPFHTALAGHPATTRLHARHGRFLDLHVSLVTTAEGRPSQMVTLVHDVTEEVHHQQVIAALHKAGGELASLTPEELADMSVEERVELLKLNLRRLIHDLLHYDIIEIRLLDRKTCRLEPLLEEGVTPEAASRVLYAQPRGNGVTGYVAATGKSYLCPNTAADPLYLPGGAGAQSSVTVPLIRDDQVIGTFNVESLQPDAFNQRDVQFAEIFARDVAAALRTLDLLTAEKHSTALRSIEAINRNVVVLLDNILSAAAALLDRDLNQDQEMCTRLRQILANGRSVKESIQKAGEEQVCSPSSGVSEETAHLGLKGKRILMVDADERLRRSAHGLLGRWGCVVETAPDARQGLALAHLAPYDFILADIRLPDRTGYDIFCDLRQAQPEARVILMTGYGYDPSHSLTKARQDGLRFILYKPFRIEQLLNALESAEPAPQPQAVRA